MWHCSWMPVAVQLITSSAALAPVGGDGGCQEHIWSQNHIHNIWNLLPGNLAPLLRWQQEVLLFLQTYPRVSSFQLHLFLNVASIIRLVSLFCLFFRIVRLGQWGEQNCSNEAECFCAAPNKKAWNTTSFKIFSRAFKNKEGYFATLWHYTKQVHQVCHPPGHITVASHYHSLITSSPQHPPH